MSVFFTFRGPKGATGPTGAFSGQYTIETKTGTYSIQSGDSNKIFTNQGTEAKVEFTLPTAAAGLVYQFFVKDSDGLKITAASGDTIHVEGIGTSIAAGYIESTDQRASIILVCADSTEWYAASWFGTWTVETS